MMDELSWRIQTLAAVAKETRCIGLCVEVQEKGAIDDSKASMKDIEAAL